MSEYFSNELVLCYLRLNVFRVFIICKCRSLFVAKSVCFMVRESLNLEKFLRAWKNLTFVFHVDTLYKRIHYYGILYLCCMTLQEWELLEFFTENRTSRSDSLFPCVFGFVKCDVCQFLIIFARCHSLTFLQFVKMLIRPFHEQLLWINVRVVCELIACSYSYLVNVLISI